MLWPKKIHIRNLITKKIPAARKFPFPSPHNVSNGPSLNEVVPRVLSNPSRPLEAAISFINLILLLPFCLV